MRLHPNTRAFAALFAFEADDANSEAYLKGAVVAASRYDERLDFAGIGPDRFLKYWHFDPMDERRMYESWHSYYLPSLASGYFIHNVVDAVSPESVFRNNEVWFPTSGKEPHRDAYARARWIQGTG